METTVGRPVLIPIRSDGHYATDDAPVGPLAVRVTLPKSHLSEIEALQPKMTSKLNRLGGIRSPLRFKTMADQNNQFDVDLIYVPLKSP